MILFYLTPQSIFFGLTHGTEDFIDQKTIA